MCSTVKSFLALPVAKFASSGAKLNLELESVLMHPSRSKEFHKFARGNYLEETTMFYEDVEVFKKAFLSLPLCLYVLFQSLLNRDCDCACGRS